MDGLLRGSKLACLASDLTQPASPSEFPRCPHCGDIVGVYEPYILVFDKGQDHSGPAADPLDAGGVLATYHRACYEADSSQ